MRMWRTESLKSTILLGLANGLPSARLLHLVARRCARVQQIIDQAHGRVAATANYELTMMYWHIGERINREVLDNKRAEYGKQIVAQVAQQLQVTYGEKGFEERNIRRMMQFAQIFPDFQIVSPLVSKLSWSHFLIVMTLKDELQREFYLTMAVLADGS